MATTREISRGNTTSQSGVDWGPVDAGSLQRIADALETHLPVIEKHYAYLIDDRERYKRWYEGAKSKAERLERSNAALRGQITKLKKAGKR